MIFAIELEKYMANTGILGIIISKLRYGKKLCPIILLKVDKGLEIGFHCTILLLSLVIRLWVEGSRESLLDAKEIA